MKGRFYAAACLLMAASPAFANLPPDQVVALEKVVALCVNKVHAAQNPNDIQTMFYQNFDAYYNRANGQVMNNATTVGDQKALFAFNKCMAENGWPLK